MIGLRSVNIDNVTSYVHQWHPKYEVILDNEKNTFEINKKYYLSTNTIVRNNNSWGRI